MTFRIGFHWSMAVATSVFLFAASGAVQTQAVAGEPAVKAFQKAAYDGKFADGVAQLSGMVRADAGDVEAVFGLGALQFFSAISELQAGVRQHTTQITAQNGGRGWGSGLFSFGRAMGNLMLVPPSPNATPMTYKKLRQLLIEFANKLSVAEQTLSQVGDRDVKLILEPFEVAIDLDNNSTIAPHERVLANLIGSGRRMRQVALGTELAFDTADASWLRGYSHVLMASANFLLAFDFEKSYDVAAHNIYGDAATAFGIEMARQTEVGRPREEIQAEFDKIRDEIKTLRSEQSSNKDIRNLRKALKDLPATANAEERRLLEDALKTMIANQKTHRKKISALYREQRRLRTERDGGAAGWIYDAVGFVHNLNWTVIEPKRLEAARQNLLSVMKLNRNTWRLVRAETDDDREWLPNAKQTPPFKAKPLTDAVIDSWLATTALAEQVLKGEKLLPHPRFKKGFNLRRLLNNAKRLDFVLLATGHDLVPYLEDGEMADQKTWNAITQPMGRHVGQYAIWFN